MDAITEGVLLLELIACLYHALRVMESWGSVLFVAILLFFEKLITIYHAKHCINEYIPIDKNIGVVSFTPASGSFSIYPPAPKQRQKKWLKAVFAIILFVFSMSLLATKLYPYLAHRNQDSTQNTLRKVPKDPQKERAMTTLLEKKYSRIDDNEKWAYMLYQNKDFDTVEKQIFDLLGQHQEEAKTYELYHLYNNLGDVSKDKDIDLKKNVLDEWCSKHPESHIPWLVRGSFYIDYAWHIRGSGWAKDVKEDAWPKFHAMLEQAQADLENSYQLNPKDPNSSCFLLIVARGLSYPRDKMEEYFRNAISACPWHFGSHYMKLQYLKPKWCGSWEEMHNFATDCLRFTERYPYLGLVMVEALEEIHFFGTENKNYLGENEVWLTIENVYDIFFAKYPEDIRRRFFYAYHAYHAKKYDVAIKQFEIIGDRWIRDTCWHSLKHYNSCRAFSYSAHAITLPPKQAVEHLQKSIDLDPTEKNPYYNLGGFSMMMGQYEEAEKAFLKVIELDPNEGKAYLQLSGLYWRSKNDFIKAKEYAEKALRCDLTGEEKRQAKSCIKSCNQKLNK
jgi:tetratricopeptide (TPR) repeat protein